MATILVQILKGLFVFVALIMTFFILLQEGKGGGLAGLGGTKAAGVEGVTNPIRRATAVLAVIFFLLAVLLGVLRRPEPQVKRDKLYDAEAPAEESISGKKALQPEAVGPSMKKAEEPGKADVSAAKDGAGKAENKAVDSDAAKADEKAGGQPAEKPAGKPGAEPDERSTEKPTGKPAKKADDKPDQPAGKATGTEKPADQPAGKKAE